MSKILFLTHRYPSPPNKGDKIRAFHIASHLAQRHDVYLGCLTSSDDDPPSLEWGRGSFADFYCARLSSGNRLMRAGEALVTGGPLSVGYFFHAGLAKWVDRILQEARPEIIYVFSSAMAQFVMERRPPGSRLIVDFVDVDSEKWRQYANTRRPPARWVFALEAERLLAFDRAVAEDADAVLLVSPQERSLFSQTIPGAAEKAVAIANGVDTAAFDPAKVAVPDWAGRPTIVFVGVMDYWPNAEGVVWFANDILPRIREQVPEAAFTIVGARPTKKVLDLAKIEGVTVTGQVEDVRPYLKGAAVVAVPLRIARGIQNKVLEAMAMARPVVTTPEALEGISARNNMHLLVGSDADSFADAVVKVLRGEAPMGLGERARQFAISRHDWTANLVVLDQLIEGLLAAKPRDRERNTTLIVSGKRRHEIGDRGAPVPPRLDQ